MLTVQITVNIELQQICRVITRMTRYFCLNALRSDVLKIELIGKSIDETAQMIGAHVIVDCFGQQ